MKTLLLLLALATTAQAQLTTTTDEFTGLTTRVGPSIEVRHTGTHTAKMQAFIASDGTKSILLYVISTSWVHLRDTHAFGLIGEQRIRVLLEDTIRDTAPGITIEAMSLTPERFASPMRIRIGQTIYHVPPQIIRDLQ